MSSYTRLKHLKPTLIHDTLDFMHVFKNLLPTGFIWGFTINKVASAITTSLQEKIESEIEYDETIDATNTIQETINAGEDVETNNLSNSNFGIIISCFASELARFYERWNSLITESIGGLSIELIEDYENDIGVDNSSMTLEERQNYIDAYLNTSYENTLSSAWYIEYAEKLGYEIEFLNTGASSPFYVASVGVSETDTGSRVGSRLNSTLLESYMLIHIISGSTDIEILNNFKTNFEKIIAPHLIIQWED